MSYSQDPFRMGDFYLLLAYNMHQCIQCNMENRKGKEGI